jgi:hypothetical protein
MKTAYGQSDWKNVQAAMAIVEPYRKVLLVLIRHAPDAQVVNAVKSLCERMQAGLEIVCLGTDVRDEDWRAVTSDLSATGLFFRVERQPGWNVDEVVAWANDRPCVAALVLAAAELPENDHDASDNPWKHLDCPLVVAGRENH